MPSRLRKIGRLRLVFGLGLLLLSVGTLVVFLEIFNVDLIAIYYHSLKPLGIVAMTLGTLIALGAKLVDVRHKMLLIKELRKTLHEQQKQEWDRSLKWKYEDALYRAGLSSKVRGGDSLRWPYEVIVEPTLKEIVEINGEAHKYQRTQITDRSREDESNGPNSVHPGAILVILFAVFLALPPEGQAFILFLVVVALMIMGSIYLINHWDEVANRLDAMRDAVSVDNAAWVIGRIVNFFLTAAPIVLASVLILCGLVGLCVGFDVGRFRLLRFVTLDSSIVEWLRRSRITLLRAKHTLAVVLLPLSYFCLDALHKSRWIAVSEVQKVGLAVACAYCLALVAVVRVNRWFRERDNRWVWEVMD